VGGRRQVRWGRQAWGGGWGTRHRTGPHRHTNTQHNNINTFIKMVIKWVLVNNTNITIGKEVWKRVVVGGGGSG